jgi:hypothetical protein
LNKALTREQINPGNNSDIPVKRTAIEALAKSASRGFDGQADSPIGPTQRLIKSVRTLAGGKIGSAAWRQLGMKRLSTGAGAARSGQSMSLASAEATRFGAALSEAAAKVANFSASLSTFLAGRGLREIIHFERNGERPSAGAFGPMTEFTNRPEAVGGWSDSLAAPVNELSARFDEAVRALREPVDELARAVSELRGGESMDRPQFLSAAELFQSVERKRRAAVERNEAWFNRPQQDQR